MSVWLQYGLSTGGALVCVDDMPSGRTSLRCPYCLGELTAKKGKKMTHHFAHTEQTCAAVASRTGEDLPLLPLYKAFASELSKRDLEELLRLWQAYDGDGYGTSVPRRASLIDREYIRYNQFIGRDGGYEFTKKGKIPVGGLSVPLFADIQQKHLLERWRSLGVRADNYLYDSLENCHLLFSQVLGDCRMYRAQLKRLLSQHLYYIKVETTESFYYKIGVTHRPIEERLSEITAELSGYVETPGITLLGLWRHCARVEHYFKYRFREQNQRIGPLTEYFSFDDAQAKKVLRELRRLKSKQVLSEEEQFILSDEPLALECEALENKVAYDEEIKAIKRRKRRSQSIRQGMKQAARRGTHVGRPKGKEAADAFLAKPKNRAIAQALERNLSLRQVARETGASVNTIRKVKAMVDKG